MANKRKNFIREKRIYCGEEYLEVDIVAVTNMPKAGKGKKGKSSQAQKNLNDKRSKRRFVQIANTNFIFDSDAAEARRQMLSGDHAQGIYQKLLVVRIRLSDLEKEPRQGMRMWIGNELYKISEVTTEYNELIIELVGEDE